MCSVTKDKDKLWPDEPLGFYADLTSLKVTRDFPTNQILSYIFFHRLQVTRKVPSITITLSKVPLDAALPG